MRNHFTLNYVQKHFTKNKILDISKNYFRPKTLPLIGIGFFFSVLSHFSPSGLNEYVNYGIIGYFFNPYVFIGLSAVVLACLRISYENEWRGHWRWKKWYKILHWLAFPTFALVASFTAYYSGISLLFFGMVNVDAGNVADIELQYLSGFFLIMSFWTMDMFNSLMGKSIWFRTPPINKRPLKEYSRIEYELKKRLPEKINKKLFFD